MKIQVITHYCIEDTEYDGDYVGVSIVKIDEKGNKVLVHSYGDNHHDKGQEKVEGFLDAMRYFNIEFELEEINAADYNYC